MSTVALWSAATLALITVCGLLAAFYYRDSGKHSGASEGALLVKQLMDEMAAEQRETRRTTWSGDLADDVAQLEHTVQFQRPVLDANDHPLIGAGTYSTEPRVLQQVLAALRTL